MTEQPKEKPQKQKALPPNPNTIVQYGQDTESAIANTITTMTDEKKLRMLSAIEPNDVGRICLLLTLGSDPIANIPFLTQYATTELALQNSVMYKFGGIRSEQLKAIVKSPDLFSDVNGAGIMQSLKSKFRR